MVVRISDKTQNYSKVTKLLVKPFKNWYQNIEEVLGNQEILFKYWCDKNRDKVNSFINEFSLKFNSVAEIKDADELPPLNDNVIEQNNN